MFFNELLVLSWIVFVNTYTTAKALLLKLGMRAYVRLSHHQDDASCFEAYQLSIKKSEADFAYYMFSEAAIVLESFDCLLLSITCLLNIVRKEKEAYAQDKSNILAKASSQLLPQSTVVFKSGGGHTYGKCIAAVVSLNCMHTLQTLEPMKAVPSVLRHLGKFTGGFSSNCVH